MVEFRFYLFTLIAVFLALGTGMFIGSALPGNEALVEKQDAIKAQIEREFDGWRRRERYFTQRVASLEDRVRSDDLFAASVLPFLVQGRLAGWRVGLVTTRDASYPAQVAATLRLAGAMVSQLAVARPDAGDSGPAVTVGWWREEGRRLGSALVSGAPAGDTGGGTGDAGAGTTLGGVVVLAHPEDRAPAVQALVDGLVEVLGPAGIPLVGGESMDTRPSLVPTYKKRGLSTVDDAETLSGQVALVLLLAGGQGHYGVKETAQGVLPLPVALPVGGQP